MAKHADTPDRQLSASLSEVLVEGLPDRIDEQVGEADELAYAAGDLTTTTQAGPTESADDTGSEGEPVAPVAVKRPRSGIRLASAFGLVTILALTALAGWLGYRGYQAQQAMQQRELFLQVARQGAVNLTTISYSEADADVQRILGSATGTFYDDFRKRSKPFIELVKQTQSKTVGTVTGAGLESVTGDQAQALVAVHVTTSNIGAPEQPPRAWRMRIDVQKVGGGAKVCNVQFVP